MNTACYTAVPGDWIEIEINGVRSNRVTGNIPPPPPPSQELINGGFENTPDRNLGWIITYAPPGAVVNRSAYGDPARARTGSGFLEANTSVSGGSVGQDTNIVPVPGQHYHARVWVKTTGTTTPFKVRLALWAIGGTQESNGTTVEVSNQWTPVDVVLSPQHNGHSHLRIEFYMLTTGRNVNFDDASITISSSNPNINTSDPIGSLDSVSSPEPGKVRVRGWSFDPSRPAVSNDVHVYVGGPAGSPGSEGHNLGAANVSRPDVASVYPYAGASHGFDTVITTGKRGSVQVCAYGIDIGQGSNRQLSNSCKTVSVPSVPPAAPATPTASADGTTITLTWPPAASGDSAVMSHEIQVENTTQGSNEVLAGDAATSAVFEGTSGVTYRFRVRARSAVGFGGWSGWSVPVEAADVVDPTVAVGSPTGGEVFVDSLTVEGSVTDDVGLSHVEVGLWSTDGGGWFEPPGEPAKQVVSLSGTEASFEASFAGVPAGAYRVMVRGHDAAGNRSKWQSVAVSVDADVVVPTVAVITPVMGDVFVDSLSVGGSVFDNARLSHVEVGLWSTDGGGWFHSPGEPAKQVVSLSGTEASFEVSFSGVPAGSYRVMVRGHDAAGNRSTWSSVGVSADADVVAPDVIVVTPAEGAVLIDSVGVMVAGSLSDAVGLSHVEVGLWSTDGGGWFQPPGQPAKRVVVVSGTEASFEVPFIGVPVGSYRVMVRGHDAAGNRSLWTALAVTVDADRAAPTVSVSSPVAGEVFVDAIAIVGTVSDNVELSRVEVGLLSIDGGGWFQPPSEPAKQVVVMSGTEASFEVPFTGVPAGSYRVMVRAFDAVGNRSPWTAIAVERPDVPAAPTGVNATSGANASSTVSWSPPADDGGAPVTRFEVQREGADTRQDTASPLNWTGLSNGGSYRFRVRACNVAGCGVWSSWSPVARPYTVPSTIGRPAVSSQPNAINVSWSAPSSGGSAITRYEVTGGRSASTSSRSVTLSFGQDGGLKTFRVRACNIKGCGGWSSDSTAVRAKTINLVRGAAAPFGYWYDTTVTGPPNWTLTLVCHDGVSGGWWDQNVTTNSTGHYRDSTLCYSGDRNPHWVTGGGLRSNNVNF